MSPAFFDALTQFLMFSYGGRRGSRVPPHVHFLQEYDIIALGFPPEEPEAAGAKYGTEIYLSAKILFLINKLVKN